SALHGRGDVDAPTRRSFRTLLYPGQDVVIVEAAKVRNIGELGRGPIRGLALDLGNMDHDRAALARRLVDDLRLLRSLAAAFAARRRRGGGLRYLGDLARGGQGGLPGPLP